MAPSVRAALKVKKAREAIAEEVKPTPTAAKAPERKAKAPIDTKREQAKGDRAGVKVCAPASKTAGIAADLLV